MKTLISVKSNLQTHYRFKLDFQKVNHILIKISPKFVPKDPTDNTALVYIIIIILLYYLNQCWPDSLTHICGARGRWFKSDSKLNCGTKISYMPYLSYALSSPYDYKAYPPVAIAGKQWHQWSFKIRQIQYLVLLCLHGWSDSYQIWEMHPRIPMEHNIQLLSSHQYAKYGLYLQQ